MTTPNRIPDYAVLNLPAEEVRPGMVLLTGVVLTVTCDGDPSWLSFETPGGNCTVARRDEAVTVICTVAPATLDQVRAIDQGRSERRQDA